MNTKIVADLYSRIKSMDNGARIVKFDLHIHTPESKDFKGVQGVNEKNLYLTLLDEVLANNIEIIAITDHNTFEGFNKLKTYISENNDDRKKYKKILVLCGIEITCYSKHLLAIFDNNFTIDKQNQFLHDIGIEKADQGTDNAMADELGPSALLKKIDEYGGITLLAHAESEKGFLHSFFGNSRQEISFKGKSLAKIVCSPYLYGIQICSEYGENRIKDVLANKDYNRKDRQLPFLRFSDAHGIVSGGKYTGSSGKPIGSDVSRSKLSFNSFGALKIALSDIDARIVQSDNQLETPQVLGCAIKSFVIKEQDSEFAIFKFNSQLNCVIGSRGTGKSTLLGIVQDVLEYESKKDHEYIDRYEIAVVFLRSIDNVFAISNSINNGRVFRSKYVKNVINDKFSLLSKNDQVLSLNLFLTKMYRQGELYDYHIHPKKVLEIVDHFIMWKNHDEYGNCVNKITQGTYNVNVLFENWDERATDLITYIVDEDIGNQYLEEYNEVLKAHDRITSLRESFIVIINKILEGKLKLKVTFTFAENDYYYLTNIFPSRVAKAARQYYEYEIYVRNFLVSIIEKSKIRARFDFFQMLAINQIDKALSDYYISDTAKARECMKNIQKVLVPDDLMYFIENSILLEYNVNSGIERSAPIYRTNTKLSLGQNAVALLLIILTASQGFADNRPLIMDQPEDDLDNSYIYNTLVDEFRRSKKKRQLLISTHNANIPVAADAENIIVLKYNGEYGYLANNGSLDNPKITKEVLDVLEGGELAMRSRNEKYRNIVKIIK